MAIGPVVLTGVDLRTQDFSNIKQNEDNKGVLLQQNAQQDFEKTLDNNMNRVQGQEAMRREEKKFDSRDKGSNQYMGDGGKNRKKKPGFDGKVTIKNRPVGFGPSPKGGAGGGIDGGGPFGFDFKI